MRGLGLALGIIRTTSGLGRGSVAPCPETGRAVSGWHGHTSCAGLSSTQRWAVGGWTSLPVLALGSGGHAAAEPGAALTLFLCPTAMTGSPPSVPPLGHPVTSSSPRTLLTRRPAHRLLGRGWRRGECGDLWAGRGLRSGLGWAEAPPATVV